MVKDFTQPIDVRDGSYRETPDSIELNWVRRKIKYILVPGDIIQRRIRFLARRITEDYRDSKGLVIVTVLQGAQKFSSELAYLIDNEHVEFDSVRISSYVGDRSTGEGKTTLPLKNDVTGKDLLIVEDIVDTGCQMKGFLDRIEAELDPRSVRLVTLTDKPARRKVDLEIHYRGFIIPDEFVVGYGMDYNEKYRNLPFIGVLRDEVAQGG